MNRIDELIAGLQELQGLMRQRRWRQKAAEMLSDQFLLWRGIADEISTMTAGDNGGERHGGRAAEETSGPAEAVDHSTPLSELLASEGAAGGDEATEEMWELATRLRECEDPEAAALLLQDKLQAAVRTARLLTVRAMIRHIWQGAVTPWQMMKHALAITRAYALPQLKGINQTELAVLLNETRQATSARERKLHDELLERWGVRGYKPDGGLKSEAARAKYAAVQRGNTSRRKGQRRQRREQILRGGRGAVEMHRDTKPTTETN